MKSKKSNLSQQYAARVLLISLFLQSCRGGFDNNPLIPTGEGHIASIQTNAQTIIPRADIHPLIDKQLRAKEGHSVTFYEVAGVLKANIQMNAPQGFSKTYEGINVYVEQKLDPSKLTCLDTKSQQCRIHLQLAQGKKPAHIVIYKGAGLMGGMLEGEEEVEEDDIPNECFCPITQEIMEDPVIAQDGHTYERAAIKRWLGMGKRISPKTGARLLSTELTANHTMRSLIQDIKAQVPVLAKHKVDMQNIEIAIKLREEEIEQTLAEKGELIEKESQARLNVEEALEEKERELVEKTATLRIMEDRIKELERQVAYFLERDKKLLGLIQAQPFAVPSLGSQPTIFFSSSTSSSSFVPENRQGLGGTLVQQQCLSAVAPKGRKLIKARRVGVGGSLKEKKGKEKLKDDEDQEAEKKGELSNQNTEQASIELQNLYAKEVEEEEQKIKSYINSLQSSSLGIIGHDHKGNTALHLAIEKAGTFLSERLKNLRIDIRNRDGSNLECLAARFIRKAYVPAISELVLKASHLINAKDNNGNTPLLLAASNGQLELVQYLIEKGASLEEKDNDGNTTLLWAARNGHLDTIKWLIASGTSLKEKNSNGTTALLRAAYNGHLDTVKWLLASGASLKEKNNQGFTALLAAAYNGHLDTVKWLLASGASLKEKDNDGDTALLFAVASGHLDTVKWLLANGTSLKEKNSNGTTALLAAAYNGHLDTVKWLLASGASLKEKNNQGFTALLAAAYNGHLDTVKWLLASGVSLEEKDNYDFTALLWAAYNGHLDTVKWLLASGASLKEKDNDGDTALLFAAANGHLDTVKWLLANGASLKEKNNDGNTALLWAARNGHLDTLKWLLASGTSLKEKDNNGDTALLLAAYNGHLDTLKWLLASGASLGEKTNNGQTVLLLAALNGKPDTVKWLLASGASLEERDKDGNTVLLLAAYSGHLDTLKWLLASGANLEEKNNEGNTVLMWAATNGKLDTVKWLLASGANTQTANKHGLKAIDLARANSHQAIVNMLS